jgi:hypothetical protein
MASENGGYTGIVAIFAIMLLAMIGGFIAWQAGVFGAGESRGKKVDVNISTDRP